MIGFFVGVIFFLITIPIRSAILILKTSTKTTEVVAFQRYRKRRKEEGKDASTATSGMKKKKKTRESMTKTELALYTTQKLLLRSLKFLLAMIQWIARLIMACSVLCWVVIGVFIVAIIGAIGAVMVTVMSDGFVISGGSNSGGGTSSGKCEDVTEKYIKACHTTWSKWRELDTANDDYGRIIENHADYGTVRMDCSGFVYSTLQEFGVIDKGGYPFTTHNMVGILEKTGKFDVLDWTNDKSVLKAGDIVVKQFDPGGHTQVYMGNDTWYNMGSDNLDHAEPWNDGDYFVNKIQGCSDAKIIRLKPVECKEESSIDTSDWIDVVLKTQKAIASKNPIYFSYDKGQTDWIDCTKEVGTWIRPDCSGIIYGMCQVLGVFPKSTDGPGDCFYTGDMVGRMVATGKFEEVTSSVPTEADLQPGDVVVGPGHTQIFMGDGLWVNGGNTEDLRKPDPAPSSYFPAGSKVVRFKK